MRNWATLVTVAVFVQLAATPLAWVNEDPVVALQKAEATWAHNKPKAYQFTVEVRCFCALAKYPVSFRVTEDKSELLDSVDSMTSQTYSYYDSIDKLFAALRRVATHRPFKMAVTYDAALGYPLLADLDPSYSTFDDELFFRVTAFKTLSTGRQRVLGTPHVGPAPPRKVPGA